MPHHLLYVENLSAEREDGLGIAVASLLGRSTGGVTLDEEDLARLGVFVGAVGQFAGQSATRHGVLALHALAGFAGGDTCGGGEDDLVADHLGLFGMLLQIVGQGFAYGLLYGSGHFTVAKFGLGLSLKLRFGHLDGDDGGQTLTEILTSDFYLGLLDLLRDGGVGIGVSLQRTGQGHTETGKVGTALYGVDIVDVGMDILRVVGIVHHGYLDGYALLLGLEIDDIVEEVGAMTIDVAHKLLQSVLGVEHFLAHLAFLIGTHVTQGDFDAGVEVSELAHTAGDDIPLVVGGGKDGGIGPELLTGTAEFGLADYLDGIQGLSFLVFLLVDLAVTEYLRLHVCGEGVYTTYADTVQTTADLVGALVELTAGVEHCHDHFKGRLVQFLVFIDRYTAAVILYSD